MLGEQLSMQKMLRMILTILSITILQAQITQAQSLTGPVGLATIPTANLPNDGEIYFSSSFADKQYNVRIPNRYHQYTYAVTMTYLPFLEVTLRLTRHYDYPGKQAMGDRMPSVRLRIFKETSIIPSLVLGAHDFMWAFGGTETIYFNALYVVASKHINLLKPYTGHVGFHLGYGTDWIKAAHYQFVGLFGGVSVEANRFITLMIEYDAEKWNGGLRFSLFNRFHLLIVALHFDALACGASYGFNLK